MFRTVLILTTFTLYTSLLHASETYALNTGEAGALRLDMQSEYAHKESCDHLAKAGLKEGQVVYDIGCGNGYMTRYMASIVGPTGHVYAMDSSSAQIELAKKRIQEAGFTNVTFIEKSILEITNLGTPPADLAYSRMLLMHLTDPAKAIQNMIGFLKPGGTLALQEPITSSCYVAGDKDGLQGFIKALLALGKHLKLDYDMGLRLKGLVVEQGLQNVTQDEHQYELAPDFACRLLMMTVKDWGGRALKEKIITDEEYAAIEIDIMGLSKPFWISKSIYVTSQKK
jgi:SAM-dependent methyltransferase